MAVLLAAFVLLNRSRWKQWQTGRPAALELVTRRPYPNDGEVDEWLIRYVNWASTDEAVVECEREGYDEAATAEPESVRKGDDEAVVVESECESQGGYKAAAAEFENVV
ncbi:hypothetical protein E2562_005051 [Oryza meyeriana var. granulata]|uniref:Uncharacterized protein n=1 Tax=Oryza meyeriana var. granulata TaxID=110450 RepID=A0A6G1BTA8_9ORYZ|nr:hypothetical protein E2562_005051 [Oryza meyeriana var. granulata]